MNNKILIVDDASFVRLIVRQSLMLFKQLQILEAKNGFEAIEIYKAAKPTLTIMDITMPELDGLSALKEIIAFDSRAQVIMCSAHSNMVDEALALGAIDFLTKPFSLDQLKQMVSQYIK